MQRYYCPLWRKDELFILSEEESLHCHSVMRRNTGDLIHILDGKGAKILAEIVVCHQKKVVLKYKELIDKDAEPSRLHIAISPTKSNDRFEWFLEKACELGVGRITPIEFNRTERAKINLDRWRKIIIASCKQSGELWFPEMEDYTKLETFLFNHSGKSIQAAIIGAKNLVKVEDGENIIIIGPEGDITEEEKNKMRKANTKEFLISKNILRVETAGIAAMVQWNYINNQL